MSDAWMVEEAMGPAANWAAVLDHYQVQYVVLDGDEDRELCQSLTKSAAWVVDFEANGALLLSHAGRHSPD